MKTNVLVALKNLIEYGNNEILNIYQSNKHNRANNMGDALEYFVKDLFCSSLNEDDFSKRDIIYSEYLSYLGNSNNPPDFIIRGAEAVEVKKIEKTSWTDIALNSSFPKDKLHSKSTLINKACRECEKDLGGWETKDMIYAIGNVEGDKLRTLWLIYGDCYAASEETYLNLKSKIQEGVTTIQGVEFSETKELGKVKKIDPLGITDLRIRGMWSISHPMKIYSNLADNYDSTKKLHVYCLMLKDKYDSFPDHNKRDILQYVNQKKLEAYSTKIKNPNNPAQLLPAVLFRIQI